jgi:hypothetical protein
MLGNRRYCYPQTITDFATRSLLTCEALARRRSNSPSSSSSAPLKSLGCRSASGPTTACRLPPRTRSTDSASSRFGGYADARKTSTILKVCNAFRLREVQAVDISRVAATCAPRGVEILGGLPSRKSSAATHRTNRLRIDRVGTASRSFANSLPAASVNSGSRSACPQRDRRRRRFFPFESPRKVSGRPTRRSPNEATSGNRSD